MVRKSTEIVILSPGCHLKEYSYADLQASAASQDPSINLTQERQDEISEILYDFVDTWTTQRHSVTPFLQKLRQIPFQSLLSSSDESQSSISKTYFTFISIQLAAKSVPTQFTCTENFAQSLFQALPVLVRLITTNRVFGDVQVMIPDFCRLLRENLIPRIPFSPSIGAGALECIFSILQLMRDQQSGKNPNYFEFLSLVTSICGFCGPDTVDVILSELTSWALTSSVPASAERVQLRAAFAPRGMNTNSSHLYTQLIAVTSALKSPGPVLLQFFKDLCVAFAMGQGMTAANGRSVFFSLARDIVISLFGMTGSPTLALEAYSAFVLAMKTCIEQVPAADTIMYTTIELIQSHKAQLWSLALTSLNELARIASSFLTTGADILTPEVCLCGRPASSSLAPVLICSQCGRQVHMTCGQAQVDCMEDGVKENSLPHSPYAASLVVLESSQNNNWNCALCNARNQLTVGADDETMTSAGISLFAAQYPVLSHALVQQLGQQLDKRTRALLLKPTAESGSVQFPGLLSAICSGASPSIPLVKIVQQSVLSTSLAVITKENESSNQFRVALDMLESIVSERPSIVVSPLVYNMLTAAILQRRANLITSLLSLIRCAVSSPMVVTAYSIPVAQLLSFPAASVRKLASQILVQLLDMNRSHWYSPTCVKAAATLINFGAASEDPKLRQLCALALRSLLSSTETSVSSQLGFIDITNPNPSEALPPPFSAAQFLAATCVNDEVTVSHLSSVLTAAFSTDTQFLTVLAAGAANLLAPVAAAITASRYNPGTVPPEKLFDVSHALCQLLTAIHMSAMSLSVLSPVPVHLPLLRPILTPLPPVYARNTVLTKYYVLAATDALGLVESALPLLSSVGMSSDGSASLSSLAVFSEQISRSLLTLLRTSLNPAIVSSSGRLLAKLARAGESTARALLDAWGGVCADFTSLNVMEQLRLLNGAGGIVVGFEGESEAWLRFLNRIIADLLQVPDAMEQLLSALSSIARSLPLLVIDIPGVLPLLDKCMSSANTMEVVAALDFIESLVRANDEYIRIGQTEAREEVTEVANSDGDSLAQAGPEALQSIRVQQVALKYLDTITHMCYEGTSIALRMHASTVVRWLISRGFAIPRDVLPPLIASSVFEDAQFSVTTVPVAPKRRAKPHPETVEIIPSTFGVRVATPSRSLLRLQLRRHTGRVLGSLGQGMSQGCELLRMRCKAFVQENTSMLQPYEYLPSTVPVTLLSVINELLAQSKRGVSLISQLSGSAAFDLGQISDRAREADTIDQQHQLVWRLTLLMLVVLTLPQLTWSDLEQLRHLLYKGIDTLEIDSEEIGSEPSAGSARVSPSPGEFVRFTASFIQTFTEAIDTTFTREPGDATKKDTPAGRSTKAPLPQDVVVEISTAWRHYLNSKILD